MVNEEQVKPIVKVVDPEAGVARPRFEKTISFEYDSPLDGKLVGNFTYRKMTLGGLAKVAVIHAQLNNGLKDTEMDENISFMNYQIASLAVWFGDQNLPQWARDFHKLYDAQVVGTLYQEGNSFEASFRKPVGERPRAAAGDSGS